MGVVPSFLPPSIRSAPLGNDSNTAVNASDIGGGAAAAGVGGGAAGLRSATTAAAARAIAPTATPMTTGIREDGGNGCVPGAGGCANGRVEVPTCAWGAGCAGGVCCGAGGVSADTCCGVVKLSSATASAGAMGLHAGALESTGRRASSAAVASCSRRFWSRSTQRANHSSNPRGSAPPHPSSAARCVAGARGSITSSRRSEVRFAVMRFAAFQ